VICQVVPEYYKYDAISQHARHIAAMLSDIDVPWVTCAGRVSPESLRTETPPVDEVFARLTKHDTLLFHFSIATPLFDRLKHLPCRKVMIYHNITPARFFKGISQNTSAACDKGRAQLKDAVRVFDLALGVSRFNEAELRAAGYTATGVLPLVVNTNVDDDRTVRSLFFRSEKVSLLHVGKWAPNKRLEDIIKVFYLYHRINPESRLILVGRNWEWENYTQAVVELIHAFDLQGKVKIFQDLPAPDLAALYRACDVYVSMSEHEGFCVPLVEAMASACPILAFEAGAIPETLGNAGILLKEKNALEIAEWIHYLMNNEKMYLTLAQRGKERARDFSYEGVFEHFKRLLPLILGETRN